MPRQTLTIAGFQAPNSTTNFGVSLLAATKASMPKTLRRGGTLTGIAAIAAIKCWIVVAS
jgi:hypothetical protein